MSKRLTAAVLIGAVTASSAAFAQGMSFEAIDTDQDGYVSYEEVATVNPAVTADVFNAADANQDSLLDPEEYSALQP
ncbi:EF-hand domain-containing protein [Rhodobacterales bacterium]|nr:EF-hand domain-containing protein [Rhodobacterales bacterium]